MTGLNREEAGGSVSRRGIQVAARLAVLWCDARAADGLAGFVGRIRFVFVLGFVGTAPCPNGKAAQRRQEH
jgi:hypothetical protein